MLTRLPGAKERLQTGATQCAVLTAVPPATISELKQRFKTAKS